MQRILSSIIAATIAATVLLCTTTAATTTTLDVDKSGLRVLYVGPNPDKDPKIPSYVSGNDATRMVELQRERHSSFKALLNEHFDAITYVNVEDWVPAMSDNVDVTIFDAQPPVLELKDVGGWSKKIRLPHDFDKPALMVGEVAPFVLGRFGFDLKIDHL